jgi:group II intron reverse transcriptase/maturase
LIRLRETAARNPKLRFTNLLHHIDIKLLDEAYRALNRKAKAGVDGEDWNSYGVDLTPKLEELCRRLHTNRYRTQPVLRCWIPKANGQQRPIGITAIEDKIVQQAVVWILGSIYENDFLGFSYGFRPGRGQHNALDAVYMAITTRKVSWVLDADISKFFDTVEHGWLMRMLKERIADRRLLSLIERMLKSGVMDEGVWTGTEVGTPQGAVISPLLGNIYLHYVLDLWAHRWRRRNAMGEMYIVRYADDSVFGFQHRSDGVRFLRELKQRLEKFGLSLNEEKTRLIEFGRFAAANRQQRGERKPETFDFLGFTHICAKRRSDGHFKLLRLTIAKRQRSKLTELREALMRNRHRHPFELGAWLRRIVQGHYNYYGVPGNQQALHAFRGEVCRAWLKALRRRSQKGAALSWSAFTRLVNRFIPSTQVVHPYPNQRFCV